MVLGKSTLSRLIAGLTKPTKGNITIDGFDTKSKKDFLNIRKKIGIVFQNPNNQLVFPKVKEDIEFMLNNLNIINQEEQILKALKLVDMEEYIDEDIYKLSLGQKQRIAIAEILAADTKYILLDEPTTMIDSKGKRQINKIVRSLKQKGYTIIYITNQIEEILLSDRVILLSNGNIIHEFNKKDLFDNIEILKDNEVMLPAVVEIIEKLIKKGKNIDFDEWTIEEMIEKIVKGIT